MSPNFKEERLQIAEKLTTHKSNKIERGYQIWNFEVLKQLCLQTSIYVDFRKSTNKSISPYITVPSKEHKQEAQCVQKGSVH